MQDTKTIGTQALAKLVGWSLLGTILIGIITALFVVQGIDINMSADIAATSENMLDAELRLRAKAYIAIFLFCLQAFIIIGLYLLLRKSGQVLAAWSLFIGLASCITTLLGAIYAMNAALIASNSAYDLISNDAQRLLLTSLQVTSDYTSFHLGLVLSSAANAGFFYLFLKSHMLPKIISRWGLFASILVVVVIVSRDFMPIFGHDVVTAAFMASNLIALVSMGLYLGIRGVRNSN